MVCGVGLIAGCAHTMAGSPRAALSAATATTPSGPGPGSTDDSSPALTADVTGSQVLTGSGVPTGSSGTADLPTGGTPTVATGTADSSAPPASSAGSTTSTDTFQPFPTTPREIAKYPLSADDASILEGRRMAQWVLLPSDYAPEYGIGIGFYGAPFKRGPGMAGLFLNTPVAAVATRYQLLAGYYTERRSTKNPDDLVVFAVLSFPDAKTASAAAVQLGAAVKSGSDPKAAVVPGRTVHGWTSSFPDQHVRFINTFLATGSLVVFVREDTPTSSPHDLAADSAAIYTKQLALLQGFTPVAADQLDRQPRDPQGLLARTLPHIPGQGTVANGVYTPTGFLHQTINPAHDKALFAAAGVDLIAQDGSAVYRTRGSDEAESVVDSFYQEKKDTDARWTDLTPPEGADYARCVQITLSARYYCVAAYGRYAVEMEAGDPGTLSRQVEAQGKLLAGS